LGHRDDDAVERSVDTPRARAGCSRPGSNDGVSTRAEGLNDATAVRAIFVASYRGPLDDAGFDESTIERLMQHRFDLQRAGYLFALPAAVWEVILEADLVVGGFLTHDDGERFLLAEISVSPEHRGRGIGSHALAGVIDRAGERAIELRLDHGSPAEAWCRRHGFEDLGADESHKHLVHRPRQAAFASTR
jgi:GNAT superfamily N-acetyltransferase